jgi:arginyl-tRNA--protein-N-Asp/Glu arginylyltransferase
MRVLQRFVESPRECAYLPERRASLEVQVVLDVGPVETERLFEGGWRRFGPIYFRPACAGCAECVSLRVLVEPFSPTKNQRRAGRACAHLRAEIGVPQVDDARLSLYAKWHASRERARGWEPNPQSADRYGLELAFPHPCAREIALYDDEAGGRLVGVSLFDATPRALSAAFFYYDPDYAQASPGTANVVSLVKLARGQGKRHLYLGYCVAGCASLRYKAAFVPHEILTAQGWVSPRAARLTDPRAGA